MCLSLYRALMCLSLYRVLSQRPFPLGPTMPPHADVRFTPHAVSATPPHLKREGASERLFFCAHSVASDEERSFTCPFVDLGTGRYFTCPFIEFADIPFAPHGVSATPPHLKREGASERLFFCAHSVPGDEERSLPVPLSISERGAILPVPLSSSGAAAVFRRAGAAAVATLDGLHRGTGILSVPLTHRLH